MNVPEVLITVATNGDRPIPNCFGKPEPFDALMDSTGGPGFRAALREARALCDGTPTSPVCPLRDACHTENTDEPWLQAMRTAGAKALPVLRPQCGTPAGYQQHNLNGETQCPSCKAAERERWRTRKARARAQAKEEAAA